MKTPDGVRPNHMFHDALGDSEGCDCGALHPRDLPDPGALSRAEVEALPRTSVVRGYPVDGSERVRLVRGSDGWHALRFGRIYRDDELDGMTFEAVQP